MGTLLHGFFLVLLSLSAARTSGVPSLLAVGATPWSWLSAVRLPHPDPELIRDLGSTDLSLLLSINNSLVVPLASNHLLALEWVEEHVVPFYPRSKISTISVGEDVPVSELSYLPDAIRNIRRGLLQFGIQHHKLRVSTTLSFTKVVTIPFLTPSEARFRKPLDTAIKPVLQLLQDSHAPLLVHLCPYPLLKSLAQKIPLDLTLFQGRRLFLYHDVGGKEYRNFFDIMYDAVVTSLTAAGHECLPLVVAGTGWPIQGQDYNALAENAQKYISSLGAHLNSSTGTPLRQGSIFKEAYVFDLVAGARAGGQVFQLHSSCGNVWDDPMHMHEATGSYTAWLTWLLVVIGFLCFSWWLR